MAVFGLDGDGDLDIVASDSRTKTIWLFRNIGGSPVPPAAPSNLVATVVSSSQINLSWTDNATNEDGFRIERCSGSGCTNFAEIATVGVDVTSYQNTGLAAGTSYGYRVRAYNAGGNSSYSNMVTATTDTATAPAFTAVSVGDRHACAVTTTGTTVCWGAGELGQLGTGNTAPAGIPVYVAGGLSFQTVDVMGEFPPHASFYQAAHSCAVTPAGTAYCWGSNTFGELGTGSTSSSSSPAAVAGGLSFESVTTGGHHSCGVTTAGLGYCWGRNYYGQLGNGVKTWESANPTPVAVVGGLRFKQISAGFLHTCGVTVEGAAYCWGIGEHGQLGNGTALPPGGFPQSGNSTPVLVSGGLTWQSVSAGWYHTCGITTTGSAYCWGDNGDGRLGTTAAIETCVTYYGERYPCATTPAPVAGGLVFSSISAGLGHTCGVTDAGAAYCWGRNGSGELGTGDTLSVSTPAPVRGGFLFSAISAGHSTACGITTAGELYCWGANDNGKLGNGGTAGSTVPVRVALPR